MSRRALNAAGFEALKALNVAVHRVKQRRVPAESVRVDVGAAVNVGSRLEKRSGAAHGVELRAQVKRGYALAGRAGAHDVQLCAQLFPTDCRHITYTVVMDRLGTLEQLLLLALVRLGDDTYGVPIRDEIETRTGRLVSPGAIYTALDRLERRGLVRSRLGDPTAERGGKRKRHYRLTARGTSALAQAQSALAEMSRGLKPRLGLP